MSDRELRRLIARLREGALEKSAPDLLRKITDELDERISAQQQFQADLAARIARIETEDRDRSERGSIPNEKRASALATLGLPAGTLTNGHLE